MKKIDTLTKALEVEYKKVKREKETKRYKHVYI